MSDSAAPPATAPASSPAPVPVAAAPAKPKVEKTRQPPGRKSAVRPPPTGPVYSSAPVYNSPYTPDDYGPDGKLRVLRKVPLGPYPAAQEDELKHPVARDLTAPVMPVAPPLARSTPTATATAPALDTAPAVEDLVAAKPMAKAAAAKPVAKVAAAKPVAKGVPVRNAASVKNDEPIDIADAPLPQRMLVERGVPQGKQGRVHMAELPPPRTVPDGKYETHTPAEFLRHDECAVATVEWIVNYHPQRDEVLEHRVQQLLAMRDGKYNPLEDPPVILDEIIPTVLVRAVRTFTLQQAQFKDGETVKNFAKKLNVTAGWNVLNVDCGAPMILPLSDLVRGEYADPALQQQMTAFYESRQKGVDDIRHRIELDRKEAAESAGVVLDEPEKSSLPPGRTPLAPSTVASAPAAADADDGEVIDAEPAAELTSEQAAAETEAWASMESAVSALPPPVAVPATKAQPKKAAKRAGVRRAGPKKTK
jgi:hypothetical protein